MKRILGIASSLVAIAAPLVIFVATPADAATRCGGEQSVGHGISLNPCISSSSGVISLQGTTFYFTSNPLERSCQVESIIYDNNTGAATNYDGTDSIPSCVANADHHATWSPNLLMMAAIETCTPGHTYYAWVGLVGQDLNGANFSTNFLSVGSVSC